MDRSVLERLAPETDVRGEQTLSDALADDPDPWVRVTEPHAPAVDIPTYELRRQRWLRRDGPRLTGIDEFLDELRKTQDEPARVAAVKGRKTTYVLLMNESLTLILAAIAIDPRE